MNAQARDVAMFFGTFGAAGSAEEQRCNQVFTEIIGRAAQQHGLEVYRADRQSEPGAVTPQVFKALFGSRVVICDITGLSPNVFYELGVAHACNLPVILLADQVGALPFYVKDERIIRTGEGGAGVSAAAAEGLAEALGVALSSEYVPSSQVGVSLGLTGPFPPVLRHAMRQASVPLYRENVSYDLRFKEVRETYAIMHFGLSYSLVNRTHTDYMQNVGVVPMRPFKPVFGSIAGQEIDPDQPDYINERGWRVQHEFPAGSVTEIQFVVDVKYPADKVRVVAESMMRSPASPENIARGVVRYRPGGALLAYEGYRLDWLAPKPAF